MLEIAFRKAFGRRAWPIALSTLLLASCGGGGNDEGAAPSANTDSPSKAADTGWTYCAKEHETCSFVGTRLVRYGANGNYAYKTATNSIACNNTVFGDPARGVAKSCWISSSPSPYQQDASLYTLTFRDEFDGTALSTSKWNDHIWYDPPSSTRDYGVEGGLLKIWPQADANGEYKERILTTKGKFEQTYGYFEMEAKLPVGAGLWPAFWLLNSDTPDTGEPEIDIMEAYSGGKTGYWADENKHPIRYDVSFYQNGNGKEGLSGSMEPYTGDLSTAFHKYAVKWEPTKISYYFDGKLVYTENVTMNRKMYVLVDMQYGSESGPVDSTTPLGPNNSFAINYVRAWKLN